MIAAWIATARDAPAVLEFYTLGALAVRSNFGPNVWQCARLPDVPVIYIRAVAVPQDTQGKGLGTALVVDALRSSLDIPDQRGAAVLFLDVLEDAHFDRRWRLYWNLRLRTLGDPAKPTRVSVPKAAVRATLGADRPDGGVTVLRA